MTEQFDVIVVGAGAAGMMSAIEAGKRGRKVLLVDHAKKIGEKIRISGGGRCNFTNIHTHPSKFENSYKDIPDEQFDEVVKYIEFLKQNPS
ncbi:NAD(P)/FAD-dependent oxidoreductase [Candidatus Pelagibacter ubique]|nr:NAD(P)/FAD-dependent oxidoreductase [Candidatus Pelagibacter ubique]